MEFGYIWSLSRLDYPMKIIFEGFYGFQNAGDDAFVEVASWGSRNYWHSSDNVFLGKNLPSVQSPINTTQYLSSVKGSDRINLMNHLRKADFFVSAGGSTFIDLPFHCNKSIAKTYSKLKPRLRLGAIGVSLGPYKSHKDEKDVQRYLKNLSFLALRDERSYRYAMSLNLPYQPVNAFDLAALLPKIYLLDNQNWLSDDDEKVIGLSICNYESYTGGDLRKEKKRNDYFKKVVTQLSREKNTRFKIFIINNHHMMGDQKISQELAACLPSDRVEIIPYSFEVKKTWEAIAGCDFMLSTRLHGAIFACYANVPFMLLEYHRKCSDFLGDIAQDEAYRLYDAEKDISETVNTINAILHGEYTPPSAVKHTIERSLKNFTTTLPNL